jgi:Tol biopolymer transport system component/tRNA A-37 threonylcarbamoyl transferase component Bud32
MPDLLDRLGSSLAGRYTIEREIGRGGMATVFLAEDLKHQRKVALKVLHPELTVTLAADRFLQEIQIAAGLNHPHILALFDSGEADGLLYYVMPYVEGESLRQRLGREGQLSVEESVRIGVEVADGLEYAHQHGVIHRDVKPGNILISSKHAVITDFGIARAITVAQGERVTSTGLGVGTPLYASPEQAMGAETLDGRTDVYSLGCVLYEMLSGEVPLAASTPQAVQARRMSETPVALHPMRDTVPPLLDQVIGKALARLPADRWETAEKFGQALMTATMDATPVARLDLASTPGLEAAVTAGRRAALKPWLVTAIVFALGALGVWLAQIGTFSTGGAEQAATSSAAVIPTETRLNLQGDFGRALDFGTGSYSISPDGKEVAYCSRDEQEGVHRLWLADLTRPERPHRTLASGGYCTWVSWNRAGDRVLFQGGTIAGRHQHSVSRHGGSVESPTACASVDSMGRPVFADRLVRVSPDGFRTAYQRFDQKHFRVLPAGSCDFTTGDSVTVSGDYERFWLFAWSPGGDRLLLETTHSGGGSTLWTIGVDPTSAGQHALASQEGTFDPVWWPAPGDAVYYGGQAPAGRRLMRVAVGPAGTVQGEPQPVAYFEDNPVDWFSISRDGQRAVVAREAKQRYRIVSVVPDPDRDPPATKLIPVTDTIPGEGAFGVSHDGGWIAYVRTTPQGSDLFKVAVSGGAAQRLTRTGDLIEKWPAWSPDDDLVAYYGWWQDTIRVRLVTSDGRGRGRVEGAIADGYTWGLSWEGAALLHTGPGMRAEALNGLEVEYGQWRGEHWLPAPPGAEVSGSFIARAQRQVLGDTVDWASSFLPFGSPTGGQALLVGASQRLGQYWFLVSTIDASQPPIPFASTSSGRPLGWTPDGGAVYWLSHKEISVWPLDGRERRVLLRLPADQEWVDLMTVTGNAAHCRPRHGVADLEFLCAVDESVTDLFLVENFDAAE